MGYGLHTKQEQKDGRSPVLSITARQAAALTWVSYEGGTSVTPHEGIEAFWIGERPERIPFSVGGALCGDKVNDPAMVGFFERGLVPTYSVATFSSLTQGVERSTETYEEDGQTVRRTTLRTPVGEIFATAWHNPDFLIAWWPQRPWLETAEDYRVRTWIVENAEMRPAYDNYRQMVERVAPYGLVSPSIGRSPIQSILWDGAGLELFAYHLVDLEEQVVALYDALCDRFRKIVEVVAAGPGRYVAGPENFSADAMGPARYERFLLPVYSECIPVLHQAGKIIGTHYDGRLSAVKDLIAQSPIDIIESLTEPPEGDMPLAECRAVWPEKSLWTNINVSHFDLTPDELKDHIGCKVSEAAPDGRRLAFEISEDFPVNWQEGISAVLEALGY